MHGQLPQPHLPDLQGSAAAAWDGVDAGVPVAQQHRLASDTPAHLPKPTLLLPPSLPLFLSVQVN